ncbi:hypothetical protein ACI48J_04380 [Paenibacillus chitinolyticus]|uniref:hypothetical protein n=1 Tax=Paenibacillus chitinolyticus TaxID=79263 RepID=UPI00386D551C
MAAAADTGNSMPRIPELEAAKRPLRRAWSRRRPAAAAELVPVATSVRLLQFWA